MTSVRWIVVVVGSVYAFAIGVFLFQQGYLQKYLAASCSSVIDGGSHGGGHVKTAEILNVSFDFANGALVTTLPTFAMTKKCPAEKNAIIVALPFAHPNDLVGLRRMCEIASISFKGWKIRAYTSRSLNAQELQMLQVRCSLCYEEIVVKEAGQKESSGHHDHNGTPMWYSKFHAFTDASVEVGLFRTILSRPTVREFLSVSAWLEEKPAPAFHVIRDHPELHNLLIVPQLWSFQRSASSEPHLRAVAKAWQAATHVFGEEAFLAQISGRVVESMVAHDAFFGKRFPRSIPFPSKIPRRGIEYCGRQADHRERDLLQGWKAMHHLSRDNRKIVNELPPCLSRWKPSTWKYEFPPHAALRDEERRYLAYCVYGQRQVDMEELVKTMRLLKRKDYYWDWNVLLFVRKDVREDWIQQVHAVGVPLEIYLVDVDSSSCAFHNRDPMLWRGSFAMALSHVDRFVVRDADSVSWPREWHAVQDWIASGLNFHFMRDHNNGHDNAVMGGMWGAVAGAEPNLLNMVSEHSPKYGGTDQNFYTQYMFPPNADVQLGHDSHSCIKYRALPFPDPTWIQFVGQTPRYQHNPAADDPACNALLYEEFQS